MTQLVELPIAHLVPDPRQPRKTFDPDGLKALAASIAAQGLIHPVVVRPVNGGKQYVIVAGERRWRAFKLLKRAMVPAIVRDIDPQAAHAVQLVENRERASLRPLEAADAYARWLQAAKRPQVELAKALGVTEAHVSQVLALRTLPAPARRLLETGVLTFAHARALLPLVPYPRSLATLLRTVEERIRWGSVWTAKELAGRVGRELTRLRARAKKKKKGRPRGAVTVGDARWKQEQEAQRRREAAQVAAVRAARAQLVAAFRRDPVQRLVARIPAPLVGPIARALHLPVWGPQGLVARQLRAGERAGKIAAWVWLKRRWATANRIVSAAARHQGKQPTKGGK